MNGRGIWCRDWWSYDWGSELDRFSKGEPLELTREEFENYLMWLSVYEPEFYMEFCMKALERHRKQQMGFVWSRRYDRGKR